ncbi:hypothetical protein AcV5_005224 [Taiwanofungus camphoratus]|nr:hypothetical protein AcW2_000174 [Antrodia cinnamomea]KAI0937280.1 hypothetical protein AcV5_005224 [Antrodia cinnamomea]
MDVRENPSSFAYFVPSDAWLPLTFITLASRNWTSAPLSRTISGFLAVVDCLQLCRGIDHLDLEARQQFALT